MKGTILPLFVHLLSKFYRRVVALLGLRRAAALVTLLIQFFCKKHTCWKF